MRATASLEQQQPPIHQPYLWLPTLTDNQGSRVRHPNILLWGWLAYLQGEDKMWISSALHKCSAQSVSIRLVKFGLKAQSCSFHTGLLSSHCPELLNLIWSVVHNNKKARCGLSLLIQREQISARRWEALSAFADTWLTSPSWRPRWVWKMEGSLTHTYQFDARNCPMLSPSLLPSVTRNDTSDFWQIRHLRINKKK